MANFQHLKAPRTRVLDRFPTKEFGNDGDIVISRISGRGVFMCSKAGGMWYVANQMQELNRIGKATLKDITTNKLRITDIANTEKSTDRYIVSESGNIQYKTGKQVVNDLPLAVNNIDYKTAYCSLERYTDKETCEANGGKWYYSENDTHDSIGSTAENQLLTISQTVGNVDAEPTLLYDGSVLEIKRNTSFDDNWQTAANDNVLKLSYNSTVSSTLGTDSNGNLKITASNTVLSGTLEISTIAADTAGDNYLVEVSGVVKKRTPAEVLSDIGAQATVTAGTNCTFSGATLNVDDAFITNDADDIMNGNLTLRKVSDDANAAELILQKERSDTTIDDNDYVGKILFKAYDDQGTPEIMTTGQISNQVLDASSNDEIAKMAFSVLTDEFMDSDVPTNFLTATGISSGFGNVQVNLGAGTTTNTFIHGQTKFTASTNGSEATNGKIHVMPYASGASPNILIESLADNGDYLKLTVDTAGASTISTVDDGGTEADLTLDPDGELILTPVTEVQSDAPLKIKESADAVADTANYGQVWVHDTTPNELCFTDDAGTDIIGIGKYEYDIKFIGYNGYTTSSYLPINGYIFDQTSTASRNEYHSFIAPYNGIIEKVSFRSEIAQDGDLRLDVLESADGTEVPGTGIFRGLTTVDIADDTYQELDMANPTVGTAYAPLTKGRIYVLYLICPSAPQDTNVTVVFKWDITS